MITLAHDKAKLTNTTLRKGFKHVFADDKY